MARKYLTLFLLCFALCPLCAQSETPDSLAAGQAADAKPKGFFRKITDYINDIDTFYISPNRYNLAFMLENSNWYENYRFHTAGDENPQKLRIAPKVNYKLGAYFGWRWIFLGYSIDLRHLFGKNKVSEQRTEFSLSLYSSVAGCDVYYRKSGRAFKIRNAESFRPEGYTGKLDKNFNGLWANIAGLNAYWILNHRRFSYPAAYSQSTNQRRNAGSVIAGFSFSTHKIKFDYNLLPSYILDRLDSRLKFKNVTYTDYSLSVGYTYNWVFARNFLLNVSLAPAIAYKKSKTNSENADYPILKNINFDVVTRAGITYNNSKYFIGASLVMNTFGYRSDNFFMSNSFGTVRIYAGFNFWKKKQYRKQENP